MSSRLKTERSKHKPVNATNYAPLRRALIERLSRMEDFVRSYEITSDLAKVIVAVEGIPTAAAYGVRGITEAQWPGFGPVLKTRGEFRAAYERFASQGATVARNRKRSVVVGLIDSCVLRKRDDESQGCG